MKLVSYLSDNSLRVGLIEDNSIMRLNTSLDLGDLLKAKYDLQMLADDAKSTQNERIPLDGIKFAPVIPRPGKIVCLGLNYYDHAQESGRQKPEYPWFFLRSSTSLAAHQRHVELPRVSSKLDYEAELAVVIGARARHLNAENALACVAGYSCFNDVSVRDYQKKTPQWTIGKNFDATGAFGPALVTVDELPPGAKGLRIECRLNGEVMQSANTSDMIWDVAETLILLSECMTLEPGDVVIMGTPAGVGQARTPPVWMKHNDSIDVAIEGIGTLRNIVQNEHV